MGKQLQVDYILEGSVLRTGQRLRINTQLVRVRDDLLASRVDHKISDDDSILGVIKFGFDPIGRFLECDCDGNYSMARCSTSLPIQTASEALVPGVT
jgi:hypothetical protein